MIGNNDEESLKNCEIFDKMKDDIEKLCKLEELIDKSKNKWKKDYVADILKKHLKL